jgi:hypothetical protein
VAALRRYLRGPVKSDRLDALTLAKMPFIDPEKLVDIYLPPAEIHALQRLTRQRKRMESAISGRKVRISAIVDGDICPEYAARSVTLGPFRSGLS